MKSSCGSFSFQQIALHPYLPSYWGFVDKLFLNKLYLYNSISLMSFDMAEAKVSFIFYWNHKVTLEINRMFTLPVWAETDM